MALSGDRPLFNYTTLRWLFVPVAALHNFEEWLMFQAYAEATVRAAARLDLRVATPAWNTLQAALLLATLVPALAVIAAATGRPSVRKESVVAFCVSIFLVNVFLPHIFAAVWMRGYAPGVVTAVGINLPFALFYYQQGVREGILTKRSIMLGIVLATVALVGAGAFVIRASIE